MPMKDLDFDLQRVESQHKPAPEQCDYAAGEEEEGDDAQGMAPSLALAREQEHDLCSGAQDGEDRS